jgi:hypothetical protein
MARALVSKLFPNISNKTILNCQNQEVMNINVYTCFSQSRSRIARLPLKIVSKVRAVSIPSSKDR